MINPLFDQRIQYLNYCKSVFHAYTVILLIGAIGAMAFSCFEKTRWIGFFCFLLVFVALFFCIYFYRQIILAKDEEKVSEILADFRFSEIFDTEFLEYPVLDEDSPLYGENDTEQGLENFHIRAVTESGDQKRLKVFYTIEKSDRIKAFIKMYPLRENHLLITYYKKSRVIAGTDLLENVNYEDSFKKEFNEIKEMI